MFRSRNKKARQSNDAESPESLSLREVEQYIEEKGFSAYAVMHIVRQIAGAVANHLQAGSPDKDSVRIKRTNIDEFLGYCALVRKQ